MKISIFKNKSLIILFLLTIIYSQSILAQENQELSYQYNEQGVAEVQKRNFKKAENLFLEAIDKDPFNLTAVFNLAGMYLTNQQNENAIKLLEAYTKRYPNDAGLHSRLGDAYFSTQNIVSAKKNYLIAIKLDETYPDIYGKIATIEALQNNLKEAEKMFMKASENDPNKHEYLANLASIQLGNAKHKEAIASAKKALQLRASSEVYITLGTAYELTESYDNALIAFQRAQDLGNLKKDLGDKIKELKIKLEK